MNPKLRNLVMFVGAVSVGVGVYLIRQDVGGQPVTSSRLADAGIRADCSPRWASCEVRLEDDAHPTDGGTRYRAVRVPYARCPEGDGGVSLLLNLKPRLARYLYRHGSYEDDGAATWAQVRDVDFEDLGAGTYACRCKRRGGACTRLDGGALPLDTTFPASSVTGAGCVPKPCVEVFGETSMPAECR